MFNFTFKKTPEAEPQKKPKYGMVIALTAVSVVVVETAMVIGAAIAKKIADQKIASQNFDDTFDSDVEHHECEIAFESDKEEETETPEESAE